MATAPERLREAFEVAGVARIAIVDDGYDPPLPHDITEQNWIAFRTAAEEADQIGALKEIIAGLGDLPGYGDVRPATLQRLWQAYSAVELEKPEREKTAVDSALDSLFRSFASRKRAKLEQLRHVEHAAEEAVGSAPERLPSTTPAARLTEFDLVFLDFFLGDEGDGTQAQDMLRAAEENACKLVQEVTKAAAPNRTPLFVIISTLASNDNIPAFRDRAELLTSKFRFLSKPEFQNDRTKMEYVLGGLVAQRASGDAVEALLHQWRQSMEAALEEMITSVRRLDVADYAYMQHYRLAEEQVSLLEYLTWLYNAYLGSLVEERLAKSPAGLVAPLKAETMPPANLPPMSEVPRIYSKVTTTQIQNFEDGQPVPIWTGDLFVRRRLLQRRPANDDALTEGSGARAEGETEQQEKAQQTGAGEDPPATARKSTSAESAARAAPPPYAEASAAEDIQRAKLKTSPPLPDILGAVSPVCDLVPGRCKAKSVLLIGGSLMELGRSKKASNHLLVHDIQGAPAGSAPLRFQVEWNEKWPQAYPISQFDGEGISSTDYVRVGRLREIYAAEIAHLVSADMARVGVPIAPPFTHALHVKAVARHKGASSIVFEADLDRPMAWELFSSKTGEKREIVFTDEFLWQLREGIRRDFPDETKECRKLVENADNLRALTTPFKVTKKRNGSVEAAPTPAEAKIVIRRVEEHSDPLPAPENQEVIVIWVAGPTAPEQDG